MPLVSLHPVVVPGWESCNMRIMKYDTMQYEKVYCNENKVGLWEDNGDIVEVLTKHPVRVTFTAGALSR